VSVLPQIAIMFTGVIAILLTQSESAERRRYACLFGLAGQPFWLWSAAEAGQWGVLLMCSLYTYAWAKGVRTHWLRKEPK
jgi:hypothetical protein